MGFRFRKSVKVAPGVRLNIGKKSAGVSIGGKGGGVSINSKTGATARVSAPGTGVSYTSKVSSKRENRVGVEPSATVIHEHSQNTTSQNPSYTKDAAKNRWLFLILFLVFLIMAVLLIIMGQVLVGVICAVPAILCAILSLKGFQFHDHEDS